MKPQPSKAVILEVTRGHMVVNGAHVDVKEGTIKLDHPPEKGEVITIHYSQRQVASVTSKLSWWQWSANRAEVLVVWFWKFWKGTPNG